MVSTEQIFLEFSIKKLRQLTSRIEVCLGKLGDEQIWLRTGDNSNAVGNLCLHLAGNVRQWILHGVNGQADGRVRDAEFAAREGLSGRALFDKLNATVNEACKVLERLPPEQLARIVRPQRYEVTVLEAIYHVVEHFAQHSAQIVYATKALCGEDLGFYRHLSGAVQPPPPPTGQETP